MELNFTLAEHLPGICGSLSSIPYTINKKENNKINIITGNVSH